MKLPLIKRLLDRQTQIKERIGVPNTVLMLSFFTGVLGATVAIILKNLLHFTSGILYKAFPEAQMNYLYLAFPLVGILLTLVFVKKVVKDDLSHGVSIALRKMFSSGGKLRVHHTYSSMIASSLTVGFGGSVGLEAPIVLTGSAVGSNLARLFELSPKNTRLLLACGATAALATIFKAPIAGIVFAIEVLMLDFTATALLPLLISAATGTVLSILFLGSDVMISLPQISSFHIHNIPFYLILGALAGLVSVYFMRTLRSIEKTIKKVNNIWARAIVGGVLLGGFIFLFPVFYGEGYEYINVLVNGGDGLQLFERSPLYGLMHHYLFFIIIFILLILFKVIASAITTASGGVGGVFAPSLFVGAFLGFFLSEICNHFLPVSLPTVNFVLAGMSGVMTGVMFAPLTGIFLIAEMTTGYELLIPLMITASTSYIVAGGFEKHSVYTYPLADEGCLKTHNKDQFAIQALDWKPLIDTNIQTISIHATLRDYTHCIAQSKRNLFVVLDDNNLFAGLLVMDDHRDIIFQTELYDTVKIEELMIHPELFIYDTDSGEEVIRKFNKTRNFNMPVITINREYLGFLSKVKVLDEYRDTIVEESDN